MATRGGRRSGPPTQAIVAPPSTGYGDTRKLVEAQQALPVAGAPQTPAPIPPQGGGQAVAASPPPLPPSLYAPTGRPDEPVQSGLVGGPGAGPSFGQDDRALIEAIARRYPTAGMWRLLEGL